MKPPPKLYWYVTPGNDEDWFVVARSARDARRFVVSAEGWGRQSEIRLERVATLPASRSDTEVGWPDHEIITELGGRFLQERQPRTVVLKGRTFTEGMLELMVQQGLDNIAEQQGHGRPYGTKRPSEEDIA